ncbi:MAG: tetratricopeptide repeat protein [Gammaproteobacteria bacterium]|nr:tetratricopeptide repeat protein [Gammaproteobacteria bacterium]
MGLGRLLHHLKNDTAAVKYLRCAVSAWPKNIEARYILIDSLYRLKQLEESAHHLEQAIALNPDVAATHNYLGIVKAQLNLSHSAEEHFLRALELQPSLAEAHKNLGTHYSEQGRFDEARDHLRKAITSRPHYAQAYWQLASLTRFSKYDDEIRTLELLHENEDVTEVDRMRLAYALGKVFHDLQEYNRAFRYWREGNDLRCRLSGYNIEPVLSEMRAMKQMSAADFCGCSEPIRPSKPRLIFILGMPRSGTSLVEQIIASHSAVYGAGELDTLDVSIHSVVQQFPEGLARLGSTDWDTIREDYLKGISACAGNATFVSDKMPGNFLHIGAIGVLFPDAKIIHCCRDAMDTGLSCFRTHFASDKLGFTCNLTDLGRYYYHYTDLMAHWGQTQAASIYDIQYESLVTEPEHEVRRLLEFCQLPFEANCLTFHENKRPVKTASGAQVRKPIYRDSLQGWKRYENELQPMKKALEQRPGRFALFASRVIDRWRGTS